MTVSPTAARAPKIIEIPGRSPSTCQPAPAGSVRAMVRVRGGPGSGTCGLGLSSRQGSGSSTVRVWGSG